MHKYLNFEAVFMHFFSIFNIIKQFVLSPGEAWKKQKDDGLPAKDLLKNFAIPIFIFSAMTKFSGILIARGPDLFFTAFSEAVILFISNFIALYFGTKIFNSILKAYNIESDINSSFKFIFFSFMPYFIVSILINLHEGFAFLAILYLACLYYLWLGLSILIEIKEDIKLLIVIITVFLFSALFFATNSILSSILPVSEPF